MPDFSSLGPIGLFISSFLAATILPLSSEIVLSALLLSGQPAALMITIATIGNVLGSIINYGLGYWASKTGIKRWLKMSEDELVKAENRFQKYGLVALCLAWVPVIGDPITVVAGALRIRLFWFILLVTIGKCGRYIVLAYFILEGSS